MKCTHRFLKIDKEKDGCSWVKCQLCGKRGPKKHSTIYAILAWCVALGNQHPRD